MKQTPDPDVLDAKLLEGLRSKKPPLKEAAEREFMALGPTAVDRLLKTLDAEKPKRRRNRWTAAWIVVGWIVLLAALSAAGVKSAGSMFGAMTGVLVGLFTATSIQLSAAGALARFTDKRAVGPLVEALEYQDKDVVKSAREALTRMLPTLAASDHALLTTQHRRILDRTLVKPKQADLSLAILGAYEQVGDEVSVGLVERVAAGETKAARDARIPARAAAILDTMRVQADLVKAAQTLLRPANAGDGSDTLLRPVAPAASTDDGTLVRPVGAEVAAEARSVAHVDAEQTAEVLRG